MTSPLPIPSLPRFRVIAEALFFGLLPSRLYERERHYDCSYWRHAAMNVALAWRWATRRETNDDRAFAAGAEAIPSLPAGPAIIGGSSTAKQRPCGDCGGPRFHLRDLSNGRSVCDRCALSYPSAYPSLPACGVRHSKGETTTCHPS
jgi:hypothetical protein